MIDPLLFIDEGGPIVHALLMIGAIGMLFAVVVTVMAGAQKTNHPASVGWEILTFTVFAGLLGTTIGVYMTASPAAGLSRQLMAHAVRVAMLAQTASIGLASQGFLLVVATGWLPALVTAGPDARSGRRTLAMGTLGATVATGLATLGTAVGTAWRLGDAGPVLVFVPVVAFLSMLGVLLASLREVSDPARRGRVASTRMMLGTAGFMGIGLLGELFASQGSIHAATNAVQLCSGNCLLFLQDGLEVAGMSRWVGWSFALIPLLTGLGVSLPYASDLDHRQALGATVATAQLLIVLTCLLLSLWVSRIGLGFWAVSFFG